MRTHEQLVKKLLHRRGVRAEVERLLPEYRRRLEELIRSNPDLVLVKIDIVRWGTPVARQHNIESIPNIRVFNRHGQQVGSPTHDLREVVSYLNLAAQ